MFVSSFRHLPLAEAGVDGAKRRRAGSGKPPFCPLVRRLASPRRSLMGTSTKRRFPLANDLLYTCPVSLPTRAILAALHAEHYWVAELSARD
jgi:hypothetical protein